jgi:hypothetical protein
MLHNPVLPSTKHLHTHFYVHSCIHQSGEQANFCIYQFGVFD